MIRVGIVNDLRIAQEVLKQALAQLPEVEIIWHAFDGREALEKAVEQPVDIILMDLIMPNMGGVEATEQIMKQAPCAIIVVTASLQVNKFKVYEAMGFGALDALKTPYFDSQGELQNTEPLLKKITQVGRLVDRKPSRIKTQKRPVPEEGFFLDIDWKPTGAEEILAIGSSTGGPQVLRTIFELLDENFPLPIVVIQHVDKAFAPGLVSWLNGFTALNVCLAEAGTYPKAGNIYLASSDDHLIVTPKGVFEYTQEPLEEIYRPSVNVFFKSLALGGAHSGIALLLTGMGADGAQELLTLKNKGWATIIQEEHSCVVYGMPKVAAEKNAALAALTPQAIGKWLKSLRFL